MKFILPIALAIGLSACSNPVEDTRPGQPVKTRQTAFKEMLRVFEPMGPMLRDGTRRYLSRTTRELTGLSFTDFLSAAKG